MVLLAATVARVGGVLLTGLPYLLAAVIGAVVAPLVQKRLSRDRIAAETALTQATLLEKLEQITTTQGAKLVEQAGTIAELQQRLTIVESTLTRTQTEKDALSAENASLRLRLAHVEEDRTADRATVEQLTADLKRAHEENRTLQAEIEILRADVGALRARVAKQDVVLIEQHIIPVSDDIQPLPYPEREKERPA